MSTITPHATITEITPLHPWITGPIGSLTFGVAMFAGDAFDLNADKGSGPTTGVAEWLTMGALALVGLAIGIAVGMRGWSGDASRLPKFALGLAIAGAVTFVAFWSGWPSAFSAVAIGLALEHRRRVGSFAPVAGAALGLGTLAFLATAYVCVTG